MSFFELLVGNTVTRVVLFPALACLPLLVMGRAATRTVKLYALAVALVELLFTALLCLRGAPGAAGFDTLRDLGPGGEPLVWIERFGIRWDLVVDGISFPLVALTGLLLPVIILGSWRGVDSRWRGYTAAMLLLTTGILGALTAFDLFLFYVFWEVMLVPMYLVIGIWGGERRIYAAVKFFLFTMAGSLLMLLALVWMAWSSSGSSGEWSFAYEGFLALDFPVNAQMWLFGAFALAFAIKVPLVPFHTWLPDAHVEAPTGGSVILAGVLLKLGTYGLIRFALPLFPDAVVATQPLLVALAVVGIVYGALIAWRQEDFKKLVAYSSVAHLGFVVLGIAALDLVAWQGALLQMVNHGLSTGALFLLVGMLYERRHTKRFDEFGGLAKVMPIFAFFLVFSTLASVGLPGLNGFVGEFLILVGSFRGGLVGATICATFGVVLAAVYLFKMLHETLWGPLDREANRQLSDLSLREIVVLLPLAALMLWIGLAPQPFLAPSRPALEKTLSELARRGVPVTLGDAPAADPAIPLPVHSDPGGGDAEHGTPTAEETP